MAAFRMSSRTYHIFLPTEIIDKNVFIRHNTHKVYEYFYMVNDRYSALHRVARGQLGLFTARQAAQAGFDARNHPYYVRKGFWEKEQRGIYRLKYFPYEPSSDYVLWSLWSCNRDGEPQGVYSYETALGIYGLTDLAPARISMTVPPGFRRSSQIPDILRLYRMKLNDSDWKTIETYRVTTPTRTLRDVIFAKHISDEFIQQAVQEGLEQGLYPKRELKQYGLLDLIEEYR